MSVVHRPPGVYPQDDGGCVIVSKSKETASGIREKWLTEVQYELVMEHIQATMGKESKSESQ